MVKRTNRGTMKDGGGAAASSSSGVAAETSTCSAAISETSRTAPVWKQPPSPVARRWGQSPSALSVALLLAKKGKLVRKEKGPSSSRRVCNISGRNRLGIVLADRSEQPHSLTLAELKEITNDFSDEQLIGEGTFGKVYKGVLQNGDIIAVKKLNLTMTGIQDKQYKNEAHHLMRLKHPNIVQLVGYCSETQKKLMQHKGIFIFAEKPERLLCLEYLPNGSLREHLSDESCGQDWNTRYKIIDGICYGLHYLHEELQDNPIIHMDLKPENILLDDKMVPKIADFGLSRLFGEEQTRICTTSCKGTPGYMAPEYIDRGIITKKLDIFSLGVIIIEIITGKRNYPYENKTSSQRYIELDPSEKQYIELVINNWRQRFRKASANAAQDIDCQQIKICIQIALLCVKFDGTERPDIRKIINMLDGSEGAECSYERQIMKEITLHKSFVNKFSRQQLEATEDREVKTKDFLRCLEGGSRVDVDNPGGLRGRQDRNRWPLTNHVKTEGLGSCADVLAVHAVEARLTLSVPWLDRAVASASSNHAPGDPDYCDSDLGNYDKYAKETKGIASYEAEHERPDPPAGGCKMASSMADEQAKTLEALSEENRRLTEMIAYLYPSQIAMQSPATSSDSLRAAKAMLPPSPASSWKWSSRDSREPSISGEAAHGAVESEEYDSSCSRIKASTVYSRIDPSDTTLTVKDGYQWRKYGQKVTSDNPSPIDYFRCALAPSCPVKKKVQRSAEDCSLLVATYKGLHNHPCPTQASELLDVGEAPDVKKLC